MRGDREKKKNGNREETLIWMDEGRECRKSWEVGKIKQGKKVRNQGRDGKGAIHLGKGKGRIGEGRYQGRDGKEARNRRKKEGGGGRGGGKELRWEASINYLNQQSPNVTIQKSLKVSLFSFKVWPHSSLTLCKLSTGGRRRHLCPRKGGTVEVWKGRQI